MVCGSYFKFFLFPHLFFLAVSMLSFSFVKTDYNDKESICFGATFSESLLWKYECVLFDGLPVYVKTIWKGAMQQEVARRFWYRIFSKNAFCSRKLSNICDYLPNLCTAKSPINGLSKKQTSLINEQKFRHKTNEVFLSHSKISGNPQSANKKVFAPMVSAN